VRSILFKHAAYVLHQYFELSHPLLAETTGTVLLHARYDLVRYPPQFPSSFCEADDLGPPLGGVQRAPRNLLPVQGMSSDADSAAVWGLHQGEGRGVVVGECTNGIGVEGSGTNGVYGTSSTSSTGSGGVRGKHFGEGHGVVGEGAGSAYAGVFGRNSATTAVGSGVRGESSNGYGGLFKGGKAQLRLLPAGGTATGKPTSGIHAKGEIYMDSAGALFVCTDGGNPATWRKVTSTAT